MVYGPCPAAVGAGCGRRLGGRGSSSTVPLSCLWCRPTVAISFSIKSCWRVTTARLSESSIGAVVVSSAGFSSSRVNPGHVRARVCCYMPSVARRDRPRAAPYPSGYRPGCIAGHGLGSLGGQSAARTATCLGAAHRDLPGWSRGVIFPLPRCDCRPATSRPGMTGHAIV
jgi:hypothetical protein